MAPIPAMNVSLRDPCRLALPHSALAAPSGLYRGVAPCVISRQASLACRASGSRSDAAVQTRSRDDDRTVEEKAVDAAMEGMSFAELCDEFECVSSPAVETTARQLARDIVEAREGNQRALRCYASAVQYSDPLCSFKGRERYKQPSWLASAMDEPTVVLERMYMASLSTLVILWRCEGPLKAPLLPLRPTLSVRFTSSFSLNLISGQVVEHREQWDTVLASPPVAALFLASRAAWASRQLSANVAEAAGQAQASLRDGGQGSDSSAIYRDPTDPRKFFQQSDPNTDLYQIALVMAFLYLVVRVLQYVV